MLRLPDLDLVPWPELALVFGLLLLPLAYLFAQSRRGPSSVKVSKILVHPIKSCKGTSVQEARWTPEGLEDDRIFMIVDANTHKALTAREVPRMVLIHPVIKLDPSSPHRGVLEISFPESAPAECQTFCVPLSPSSELLKDWKLCEEIELWQSSVDGYICQAISTPTVPSPSLTVSEMLSAFLSRPVHLLRKGPRPRPLFPTHAFPDLKGHAIYQDGYPLLVVSDESLTDLNQRVREAASSGKWASKGVGKEWSEGGLIIERFRPNIVFSGANPYAEDSWETITIGASSSGGGNLTLVSRCTRCMLPNIEPSTGVQDPAVPLKILSSYRRVDPTKPYHACFGVNAVPAANGIVRVGDSVRVLKFAKEGKLPKAKAKKE